MAHDDSAPATKLDIRLLMEEIGKLYIADECWKDEMLEAQERWKDEIKHHFDVVAENIKHDFLYGALHDKVQQHEDRIQRLEKAATR